MSAWESAGKSNEWYTPPWVFEMLGERYDVDVASPPFRTHVPCQSAIYAGSLAGAWPPRKFVWMNAPFGDRNGLEPWLERFFDHGYGIALTPDRTSAPWFWKAWDRADAVLFTRKIRFLRPNGTQGISPSTGTALWAAGERAHQALRRMEARGGGILAIRERSAA